MISELFNNVGVIDTVEIVTCKTKKKKLSSGVSKTSAAAILERIEQRRVEENDRSKCEQ